MRGTAEDARRGAAPLGARRRHHRRARSGEKAESAGDGERDSSSLQGPHCCPFQIVLETGTSKLEALSSPYGASLLLLLCALNAVTVMVTPLLVAEKMVMPMGTAWPPFAGTNCPVYAVPLPLTKPISAPRTGPLG